MFVGLKTMDHSYIYHKPKFLDLKINSANYGGTLKPSHILMVFSILNHPAMGVSPSMESPPFPNERQPVTFPTDASAVGS